MNCCEIQLISQGMLAQTVGSDFKIETIDNAMVVLIPSQISINEDFVHKLWFELLVQKWKNETKYYSFSKEIVGSDSYKEILKMGKIALPFIFGELEREPTHWFHALKQITNENPVKETSKGNIQLMTNDWVSWAKTQGIY